MLGVPVVAQRVMNPASIHEVAGLIHGLTQWVKDLALLWLWRWQAAAAQIQPLAWEPPYAEDAARKKSTIRIKNKIRCFQKARI